MNGEKFLKVLPDAHKVFWDSLDELMRKNQEDEEWLSELEIYIDDASRNGYRWDLNKVKTVLQILQSRSNDSVSNALTYLKQSQYGWQGVIYRFPNQCLRHGVRCRYNYVLSNEYDVKTAFQTIYTVFTHEKFGGLTTYLFAYALIALFSSRLSQDDIQIPYFLQIACERNSNVYKLIHEIVHICDVNAGIIENCHEVSDVKYGCTYDHITLFPVQSAEKTLGDLMYNRDIPVVIEGFESEVYYNTLLREIANIHGKIKNLDIKNRFNTLPIFICPTIRSQYRNVFSMDLTELEISDEYVELIQKNKQMFGSWALELVIGATEHTFCKLTSEEQHKFEITGKRRYFRNINNYINSHRVGNELSGTDVTNVGILYYFLNEYIEVIERSVYMSNSVVELFKERKPYEYLKIIFETMKNSLALLHNKYSPLSPTVVSIDTGYLASDRTTKIRKTGEKYAKDIVKHYQSYGVAIKVLPEAQFRDERYIFSVKLMPGTDGKQLYRRTDEVRRLLDVETFYIEKSTTAIRIVVSKKSVNENSLKKILESTDFRNSKMEIPYAVGYDIMGKMIISDVSEFPHLLIGGTSGSGKSSAIHSLLTSIVVKQPPEKVKLLLLDFGSSRMTIFKDVPHLLTPVIKSSEIEKGRECILWLQKLMKERLEKKDSLDDRKHDKELEKWPYIICVIDEFQRFVQQLNDGRGNKDSHRVIEDLLARARKVKIHLILATQEATKGSMLIKNTNLAAGIAFKCTNWSASKAIIDDTVATELSGKGSMYFKCDQYEGLKRMQGSFMDANEIIDYLDDFNFSSLKSDRQYDVVEFETFQDVNCTETVTNYSSSLEHSCDEELLEIVHWIIDKKVVNFSNNNLKKYFGMGYNRANVYMDQLQQHEIITKLKSRLPRKVIIENAYAFLKKYDTTYDGDRLEMSPSLSSKSDNVHEQGEELTDDGKTYGVRDKNVDDISTKEFVKGIKKLVKENSIRKSSPKGEFHG